MLTTHRHDEPQTTAPHPGAAPIERNEALPPAQIPPGHVGEFVMPGTGRTIWWTGRVAIGLLYQPQRHAEALSRSALWLQDLLRGTPTGLRI